MWGLKVTVGFREFGGALDLFGLVFGFRILRTFKVRGAGHVRAAGTAAAWCSMQKTLNVQVKAITVWMTEGFLNIRRP